METTTETINAILVGRHAPEGLPENISVIDQKNILWSLDHEECYGQLWDLLTDARNQRAKVLLQNVPGTLAAAMVRLAIQETLMMAHSEDSVSTNQMGIIISVPGERQAGVVQEYRGLSNEAATMLHDTVTFANSRARVVISTDDALHHDKDVVTITVDPVTPFVFSHIEWL